MSVAELESVIEYLRRARELQEQHVERVRKLELD